MAFVNFAGALPRSSASRLHSSRSVVTCSAPTPKPVSRRALLAGAAALAGLSGSAGSSLAAEGGVEQAVSKFFFPKKGFNAPDAPQAGTIDRSVFQTSEGKAAISTLKGYQEKLDTLYTSFKDDPQAPLPVKDTFQISKLRDALNTFDDAFDEEAQKETDKVVRGIIQDIGELQNAAALKPGAPRTKKKIERTQDWFETLTRDFNKLLSYYS